MNRIQSIELYTQVAKDNDFKAMRELCKTDLFYLLFVGCKRADINRDWLFDRCKEVQMNPDGYIDLWFREGYKSTIITFGKSIQDILNNPDITIGIFSHTRPIAKAFLQQIKRELELNEFLQGLFPDILYKEPYKSASKWSLDDGIIVRRNTNPKEATIEAWGLIDGQPTSKHYKVLVYDDVVTRESVTTTEMIKKTTEAFSLSLNLGAKDGKRRLIGTRYHQNDTYKTILDRHTAIPRIYPATEDGTLGGKPILFTQEEFNKKVEDMGSYIAASQLMMNPLLDKAQGFLEEWIEYYNQVNASAKMNKYILIDSASEKKKTSDYTVMAVIGLAEDNNYYLLDAVRDRMNLTERTRLLFSLVRKWNPIKVGYEKYGMQSDIEHIKYVQNLESYRFQIVELGGQMSKVDRVRRLIPLFENHRFYIPYFLKFMDVEGGMHDFVREFIDYEYLSFPVSTHDDMLDCMSRIVEEDLMAVFPKVQPLQTFATQKYDVFSTKINHNKYNPLNLVRI